MAKIKFDHAIEELKSKQEKFKDSINHQYALNDLRILVKEFPFLEQEENYKQLELTATDLTL